MGCSDLVVYRKGKAYYYHLNLKYFTVYITIIVISVIKIVWVINDSDTNFTDNVFSWICKALASKKEIKKNIPMAPASGMVVGATGQNTTDYVDYVDQILDREAWKTLGAYI